MDQYSATERAYKNGYAKGYEEGKRDAGKQGERKTNGDWIRGMRDEDLAEVLYQGGELGYCTNKPECGKLLDTLEGIPEENCKACLMAYLAKEREDKDNG